MKGCICPLMKGQIHPFISKVTVYAQYFSPVTVSNVTKILALLYKWNIYFSFVVGPLDRHLVYKLTKMPSHLYNAQWVYCILGRQRSPIILDYTITIILYFTRQHCNGWTILLCKPKGSSYLLKKLSSYCFLALHGRIPLCKTERR